jgi:hypothetical protein
MNKIYTCCFFGHRTITQTKELKTKLYDIIENLIVEKQIDTFLFGSKSRFNDLCLELVTALKEKYPHIKRIYVRAEYPIISEQYKNYLFHANISVSYMFVLMNFIFAKVHYFFELNTIRCVEKMFFLARGVFFHIYYDVLCTFFLLLG